MSKEAMKLALEALEHMLEDAKQERLTVEYWNECVDAITALREALAEPDFWEGYVPEPDKRQQALDKKAENARELGLDYEPVCNKDPQGCWNVRCQLGKKCKNTPAQQEPVAWPAGLIERIKSAEQRIQDGHAPRRIPADPTDVDLVLAEVRYLLEGKQPPFWVATSPPAQRKPLTDEEIIKCWGQVGGTRYGYVAFARAIEAVHGIKENT